MIAFFANIFGYLLNFLYNIVGNYGFAIILFSLIIKLLMLPLSVKQQKSMKKNNKIQEEMKQIQFKYKNDPEKLNQETMLLYKRENMNPLSGCFSAILQIILLFSVFYLVRSPLTYMKKIDSQTINTYIEEIKEAGLSTSTAYPEIEIIREIENIRLIEKGEYNTSNDNEENTEIVEQEQSNENTEVIEQEQSNENNTETEQLQEENKVDTEIINDENISEQSSKIDEDVQNNNEIDEKINNARVNMEFFGIDLSKVPTASLNDFRVFIIPILYVISSFISIKMTSNMQKKQKEQEKENSESNETDTFDSIEQANKSMSLMMPIMSISIASIAPLGLALYWLINNILMIFERIALNKFLKDED